MFSITWLQISYNQISSFIFFFTFESHWCTILMVFFLKLTLNPFCLRFTAVLFFHTKQVKQSIKAPLEEWMICQPVNKHRQKSYCKVARKVTKQKQIFFKKSMQIWLNLFMLKTVKFNFSLLLFASKTPKNISSEAWAWFKVSVEAQRLFKRSCESRGRAINWTSHENEKKAFNENSLCCFREDFRC